MTEPGSSVEAFAVALQTNGAIVAEGQAQSTTGSSLAVARLTTKGVLDTTFGTNHNGEEIPTFGATSPDAGRAIVLQPDGKIVLAGSAVVRLNPDGGPTPPLVRPAWRCPAVAAQTTGIGPPLDSRTVHRSSWPVSAADSLSPGSTAAERRARGKALENPDGTVGQAKSRENRTTRDADGHGHECRWEGGKANRRRAVPEWDDRRGYFFTSRRKGEIHDSEREPPPRSE